MFRRQRMPEINKESFREIKAEDYKYVNGVQLYNTTTKAADPTHAALGVTTYGAPYGIVLSKANNVLVGGPKNSGKTEAINTILLSMMSHATPHELELYIVSDKHSEYIEYESSPFLKDGVIRSQKGLRNLIEKLKVDNSIKSGKVGESLSKSYREYNQYVNYEPGKFIPDTVIVIDELDLRSKEDQDIIEDILDFATFGARTGVHFLVSMNDSHENAYPIELLDTFRTLILHGNITDTILKSKVPANFANFKPTDSLESVVVLRKGRLDLIDVEIVNRKEKVEMMKDHINKYPLRDRSFEESVLTYIEAESRFTRLIKSLFH